MYRSRTTQREAGVQGAAAPWFVLFHLLTPQLFKTCSYTIQTQATPHKPTPTPRHCGPGSRQCKTPDRGAQHKRCTPVPVHAFSACTELCTVVQAVYRVLTGEGARACRCGICVCCVSSSSSSTSSHTKCRVRCIVSVSIDSTYKQPYAQL